MAKKSRPLWFGWDVPVAVLLCGPALSVFEGEDWTSGNLTKGPALIFHRLVPAGMTLKTHTLVITFLPLDFVQWKSFGPPFAEGGHGTMFQKGKLEDEASLVFFFPVFCGFVGWLRLFWRQQVPFNGRVCSTDQLLWCAHTQKMGKHFTKFSNSRRTFTGAGQSAQQKMTWWFNYNSAAHACTWFPGLTRIITPSAPVTWNRTNWLVFARFVATLLNLNF